MSGALDDSRAAYTAALNAARSELEEKRGQVATQLQLITRTQAHIEALREEREALQAKLNAAEAQVVRLKNVSHALWLAADGYRRRLEAVLERQAQRRLKHRSTDRSALLVALSVSSLATRVLIIADALVLHRPALRLLAVRVLRYWPAVHGRLRSLRAARASAQLAPRFQDGGFATANALDLSASARLILLQTQTARAAASSQWPSEAGQ